MGNCKVKDISDIMNSIAPESTAEDYDNVGLLAGDADNEVTGIVIALDVNEDTVDFAVQNECNLIITHHPLIFSPLRSVTSTTAAGKILLKLLTQNISLYAAHTNFDRAQGGTDDVLADMIGMKNAARLENKIFDGKELGFGRIGNIEPMSVKALKEMLSHKLGCTVITTADDDKIIKIAASCAGAGGQLVGRAAEMKADIFITGEVNYHTALDAKRIGLDIMLLSHQHSEQCALNFLKNALQNRLKGVKYNVRVILAPFKPLWS